MIDKDHLEEILNCLTSINKTLHLIWWAVALLTGVITASLWGF